MPFPRWMFFVTAILSIAALYLVFQAAKWAGPLFCFGFLVGGFYTMWWFKSHYGWWPDFGMDGKDKENSRLPRIKPRDQ
jgi:hypothetical protein